MESNEELNMADEVSKFRVSWVTIHVMNNAIQSIIRARNCNCIPGPIGGMPNIIATRNNRVSHLAHNLILLSKGTAYGIELLSDNPVIRSYESMTSFHFCPRLDAIFEHVLHNCFKPAFSISFC